MMQDISLKEKNLQRQIQEQMKICCNALLQLYKFQGAVWTDAFNPDEGLIMSCEGVYAFLVALCFEGNEGFKDELLSGKVNRPLIKSMIEEIAQKKISGIAKDTTPYLDFLKTSGKTGEGMLGFETNPLSYTESVYSLARALWFIDRANLQDDLAQNTLNNCRTLLNNLLDYSVRGALNAEESDIKIVGWSYTNSEDNFKIEEIAEGRQYLIPYFTYNAVNLVYTILSMEPDPDTMNELKKYDDSFNELYEWLKDHFFTDEMDFKIEEEPITSFGDNLLDLGPSGFPLYNNTYIVSTLLLILAWKQKRGENLGDLDEDFREKIKKTLIYINNQITKDNINYFWEAADDTIGEHMFRLVGKLWKLPRAKEIFHKKVFIDRTIYPMMLKALCFYGMIFKTEIDQQLSPLLKNLFAMQIKKGRYKGMWHGRAPSIYYTNRVVDALVDFYKYTTEINSSLNIDDIIAVQSVQLAEVGIPPKRESMEIRFDDIEEKISQLINKIIDMIPVSEDEALEKKIGAILDNKMDKKFFKKFEQVSLDHSSIVNIEKAIQELRNRINDLAGKTNSTADETQSSEAKRNKKPRDKIAEAEKKIRPRD